MAGRDAEFYIPISFKIMVHTQREAFLVVFELLSRLAVLFFALIIAPFFCFFSSIFINLINSMIMNEYNFTHAYSAEEDIPFLLTINTSILFFLSPNSVITLEYSVDPSVHY